MNQVFDQTYRCFNLILLFNLIQRQTQEDENFRVKKKYLAATLHTAAAEMMKIEFVFRGWMKEFS